MMKTAVTVLQEMMVKMGEVPEYECIAQSGLMHQVTFEYQCKALGERVTGVARSKKEAKQEAARLMLARMAARGRPVPPPYAAPPPAAPPHAAPPHAAPPHAAPPDEPAAPPEPPPVDIRSYVALLKELCEEYRMPGVEYELVGDTGPPHMRHFTYKARIGQHERVSTSTTKKAARQLAAEQLYKYLRENLAHLTQDFVEEDALARAHEKVMDRYMEVQDELGWRPDLGQKIADYHLGLVQQIGAEARARAAAVVAAGGGAGARLEAAAGALGLRVRRERLPAEGGALCVLALEPSAPALAWAGDEDTAAEAALDYIARALRQ